MIFIKWSASKFAYVKSEIASIFGLERSFGAGFETEVQLKFILKDNQRNLNALSFNLGEG